MNLPPFTIDQNPCWQIIPTFSNPLASCFIDLEICKKLYDLASDQDWIEDSELDGSLGATTINKKLLNSQPEIAEFIRYKCLSYIIDVLNYQTDIQFTSSWLTRTYKGGACLQHSHTNSWYSGIIYFGEYDEDSAPIEFYDPVHKTINVEPFNYNYFNSRTWRVEPKTSMMLMFPSYVRHKVLIHKTDALRYSLAFNIMPKGLVGHDDSIFEY
jgi:uncharacterized protein (TIGR02466 family)